LMKSPSEHNFSGLAALVPTQEWRKIAAGARQ
jgi:hypothetical protein